MIMDTNISINQTSISISNYHRGDNPGLEKRFQIWNDVYFRYEDISLDINEDTNTLYIPRGIDNNIINRIAEYDDMSYSAYTDYHSIKLNLLKAPRDERQNNAISFLTGEGTNFTSSRISSQVILTAPPGFGKTYCAVAATCHFRMKTAIISYRKKILDQWVSSYVNFTDIDSNDILEITSTIYKRIINNKIDVDRYKIFIFSQQTIGSICKGENGWYAIGELFEKLHIGLKIIDEAHRHFRNTLMIDFYTNVKKTIYLTATLKRSDIKEDKLYQDAFRSIPKYGEHLIEDSRKHIIYIEVIYNSRPTLNDLASMKGYKGYFDRNKYIDYQIERGIMDKAIIALFDKYFSKHEGRTIIMSSKIDSTVHFKGLFEDNFPDRNIGLYHSKIPERERIEVLSNKEIISCTPKALGEGADIKGLRYLIMTEPFSSEVNAFQNPSRIRPYADDKYSFYVEFIDKGIPEVIKWQKRRMKMFKRYFHSARKIDIEDLI